MPSTLLYFLRVNTERSDVMLSRQWVETPKRLGNATYIYCVYVVWPLCYQSVSYCVIDRSGIDFGSDDGRLMSDSVASYVLGGPNYSKIGRLDRPKKYLSKPVIRNCSGPANPFLLKGVYQ